ncbi:hypothetical protein FOA52_014997 [Chlamydomonas sp. UWO 241]|nr:hypothetical protein FOA52_014997 [Chlamydomonas sp. UWO 241]
MPPLARRDVKSLVRKLGADARPSQQQQALNTIMKLSICDGDRDSLVAIAAAGAIPPLVQLLGGLGSSAGKQGHAAVALGNLAMTAENAGIIAAAGAVPPLVHMLGPRNVAVIVAAGAIPPLVQLTAHGATYSVQGNAAGALMVLAVNAANQSTIAATGAIPPLVKLLGAGSPNARFAVAALNNLALNNPATVVAIAKAGAIPALVRLLGPGSDTETNLAAAQALIELCRTNTENRAATAAAGVSANLVREMETIGLGRLFT